MWRGDDDESRDERDGCHNIFTSTVSCFSLSLSLSNRTRE